MLWLKNARQPRTKPKMEDRIGSPLTNKRNCDCDCDCNCNGAECRYFGRKIRLRGIGCWLPVGSSIFQRTITTILFGGWLYTRIGRGTRIIVKLWNVEQRGDYKTKTIDIESFDYHFWVLGS